MPSNVSIVNIVLQPVSIMYFLLIREETPV